MSDYIPPELIPNILARLPVADVLRCTSVCKSWYDLITSSSFISLHLKLLTPNQESRLLVKRHKYFADHDHCRVYRDNQIFDEIAGLECSITSLKWSLTIIGSINGLLCLKSFLCCRSVLLWNHSIRKSLKLPDSGFGYPDTLRYGFCFLPETNDYKIVSLSLCDEYTDFIQVDIYELSINSWRNVSVGEVSYLPLNDNSAVFLEGSLHWGVIIRDGGKFGRSIISFDMKNENLGALSVPNCLDNEASHFDVVAFKESLCLIHPTYTHYNIWVMKEYGVSDSWIRQFKFAKQYCGPMKFLYFRGNEEIIFEKFWRRQSVLARAGAVCRRLVSYDPTSSRVTDITEWEDHCMFGVSTYVESLVLIKSSNPVF